MRTFPKLHRDFLTSLALGSIFLLSPSCIKILIISIVTLYNLRGCSDKFYLFKKHIVS